MALALIVGLLTYNLADWPVTWYDEGFNLQAAKNLAQLGRYGLQRADGFRDFDAELTTGPTVVGPIALAFSLLGVDLIWARLVIVAFGLTAVIGLFWLTRKLFDGKTAIVACMLMLATPLVSEDASASFIGLSRMAMGEVPALSLVLAGILLWIHALEKDSNPLLAGSGLLFGLGVISKPQCLLVLLALGFAWGLDRVWHRQARWASFVLPTVTCLASAALWYGYQSYATGSGLLDFAGVAERAGANLPFLSPRQIVRNLRTLLASGNLTWGLPGLVYALHLSKGRTLAGLQRSFLVLLSLTWMSWFVAASIGWLRYAFLPMVITGVFSAKLLVDLGDGFSVSWRALRPQGRPEPEIGRAARTVAVAAAIALMVFAPLQRTLKNIITADDHSPTEFASYLDANIQSGATIACFEAEIAFLSGHLFDTPSLDQEVAAIRHVQMGLPYPPERENTSGGQPAYVVDGPMSKWTEFYAEELRSGRYTLVLSIGPYDLYQTAGAASETLP